MMYGYRYEHVYRHTQKTPTIEVIVKDDATVYDYKPS